MVSEYITKTGAFNAKKVMVDTVTQAVLHHTAFLVNRPSFGVRISYLVHGAQEQLKCGTCGVYLLAPIKRSYTPRSCSVSCHLRSSTTKEKRRETNLARYGVDNPFRDTAKIQQATYDKLGVHNASSLASVKEKLSKASKKNYHLVAEKMRKASLEKYGVEYASQAEEIKAKTASTNLARYGTACSLASDAVRERTTQTLLARYGVDNPSKSADIKKKIAETKKIRYGDSTFSTREQARQTMLRVYGTHQQNANWSDEVRAILETPDLLAAYVEGRQLTDVAIELGIHINTVKNYVAKYNIISYSPVIRSLQETFIKNILHEHDIPYMINNRSLLKNQELDFFIPEKNLAFEVNGIYWHSERFKCRSYHLDKTQACNEHGVRLLHFWDYQINERPKVVRSIVEHLLGVTPFKMGARKLSVSEVSSTQSRDFLIENHLQGPVNATYKYGLYHENELMSLMTFGKSRFAPGEVELLRFCNKIGWSIPGAASKLLAHFAKVNQPNTRIITYANRDISAGAVYTAIGFTQISVSPPSYLYFNSSGVYNRMMFQKHKLSALLTNFSPELTEWENMKNNGYNRFWNTGTIKYEFITP